MKRISESIGLNKHKTDAPKTVLKYVCRTTIHRAC